MYLNQVQAEELIKILASFSLAFSETISSVECSDFDDGLDFDQDNEIVNVPSTGHIILRRSDNFMVQFPASTESKGLRVGYIGNGMNFLTAIYLKQLPRSELLVLCENLKDISRETLEDSNCKDEVKRLVFSILENFNSKVEEFLPEPSSEQQLACSSVCIIM